MKKGLLAVVAALTGATVGVAVVGKKAVDENEKMRNMSDKHLGLFLMMNQWVKIKQDGKNLSLYFESNGYKEIAIYGMSYAGETLLDELKDSKTDVKYGIDKKADEIYCDVPIVTPDKKLEQVDAIVVTSIYYIDEITEMLSKKISCPIISLEDIMYEI